MNEDSNPPTAPAISEAMVREAWDATDEGVFAGSISILAGYDELNDEQRAYLREFARRIAALARPASPAPAVSEADVFDEARAERVRAHRKHADTSMESQPVDSLRRLAILVEEVGEVAKEFNDAEHDARPVDRARLRKELIQTAAMAGAWADVCGAAAALARPEGSVSALSEYRAALLEIAQMPCITRLLGEDPDDNGGCGCASCRAMYTLRHAVTTGDAARIDAAAAARERAER